MLWEQGLKKKGKPSPYIAQETKVNESRIEHVYAQEPEAEDKVEHVDTQGT
jgi:hypothetical protein